MQGATENAGPTIMERRLLANALGVNVLMFQVNALTCCYFSS